MDSKILEPTEHISQNERHPQTHCRALDRSLSLEQGYLKNLKSIFTKIFLSRAINNNTAVLPTTLEAKAMLPMIFAALIGLLTVNYKINGHGNLVPWALFPQPTFTFFTIIIMISFYFTVIGIILEKTFHRITGVLNVISFVCIVLGVTVLLWALIPNSISWIPWFFFACTIVAVLGVFVYGQFTDKSSTLSSTASLEIWVLSRETQSGSPCWIFVSKQFFSPGPTQRLLMFQSHVISIYYVRWQFHVLYCWVYFLYSRLIRLIDLLVVVHLHNIWASHLWSHMHMEHLNMTWREPLKSKLLLYWHCEVPSPMPSGMCDSHVVF